MLKETFVGFLEKGIIDNWEYDALSDYKGETYTYSQVAGYTKYFHEFFEKSGINKGDKIAVIAKNSARWGILYIAIVSYGAVLVPVLPDFKTDDLHQIVNHSDAKMLFLGSIIIKKVDLDKMPNIENSILIDDFSIIRSNNENIHKTHNENIINSTLEKTVKNKNDFSFPVISNENLALISYTSGTTGTTKGVMLQHNSLAANIRFAMKAMELKHGDKLVSFLPLAHAFGGAFEFLYPFCSGCHITILTKTPSPQIIIKAFQEIKPSLIFSVPLVIEKIYKNRLLPVISKWYMKLLLSIPGINNLLLKKFNSKLSAVFGNNFQEIVIGGAPLSKEAETFFRKMKFRFNVGYGMTECGPLISYEGWEKFVLGSSGKVVDTLEIKIDSEDQEKITGEIMVRGDNVMLGYYKNEEATKAIIDKEGWLHTGDLGVIDKEGNIHIKGRSKTMILGANGKNIYPEEIEAIYNNREGIAETLIIQRDQNLLALLYPDYEYISKEKLGHDEQLELFEHHQKTINHQLPGYMNVKKFEIHEQEFVKTPKKSIKRYLYQ